MKQIMVAALLVFPGLLAEGTDVAAQETRTPTVEEIAGASQAALEWVRENHPEAILAIDTSGPAETQEARDRKSVYRALAAREKLALWEGHSEGCGVRGAPSCLPNGVDMVVSFFTSSVLESRLTYRVGLGTEEESPLRPASYSAFASRLYILTLTRTRAGWVVQDAVLGITSG